MTERFLNHCDHWELRNLFCVKWQAKGGVGLRHQPLSPRAGLASEGFRIVCSSRHPGDPKQDKPNRPTPRTMTTTTAKMNNKERILNAAR